MSTSTKVLLAVAAALAVTGSAWYLVREGPLARGAVAPEAEAAPAVASQPAPLPLVPEPVSLADRSAIQETEPAKPVAAAVPSMSTEPTLAVARCLEKDLRPAVRAWLGVGDRWVAPGHPEPRAEASSTGEVQLELDPKRGESKATFAVGAEGCATRFVDGRIVPGQTTWLGDVVLEPGGAVSGTVRDVHGGPIAGADVVVANPQTQLGIRSDLETLRAQGPPSRHRSPHTLTDASGAFRVEGAPAGSVRVWACAEGMSWSFTEPLDVPARGELERVAIVLEPRAVLAGSAVFHGIVRAPDGTPIAKPEIRVRKVVGSSSTSTSRTGETDGRFEFAPLAPGPHQLVFRDPAGRWTEVRLESAVADGRELEIVLREAHLVAFYVRGPDGPVSSFEVEARPEQGAEVLGPPIACDAPDGRARVRAPAVDFRYLVTAPGFARKELGPFLAQEPPVALEVELAPMPGLRGRVAFDGRPVAGAEVRAHEDGTGKRIQVDDFLANVHPDAAAETKTAADGTFQLDIRESGSFIVFAHAEGFATARTEPIQYSVEKGSDGHEIALVHGGAVEGRVRVAAGRRAEGTIVALNSGDARVRTQVVGPDGQFRFERLTPGPWQLERAQVESSGRRSYSIDDRGDGAIPFNVFVVGGETTHADLDLTEREPCAIAIELRTGGAPAKAWQILVFPQESFAWTGELPQTTLDVEGHGTIELDEPGVYFLEARPPPELQSRLTARYPIELKRGANEFERELELGRVEGWIRISAPSDEVSFSVVRPNGPRLWALASVAADGRFEIPLAPAGEGQLSRNFSEGAKPSTENLTRLTLQPGQSHTVDLR